MFIYYIYFRMPKYTYTKRGKTQNHDNALKLLKWQPTRCRSDSTVSAGKNIPAMSEDKNWVLL